MGILRRLFGSGSDDSRDIQWYDLPDEGYFLIAGGQHYNSNVARSIPMRAEAAVWDDVTVTLRHDASNAHDPNAVEVRLNDHLIGYIPRENSEAWATYLARLGAAGYQARVRARIRAVDGMYWVNLRADPAAGYLLPDEQAARIAQHEREVADRRQAKAARDADRVATGAARDAARRERDEARAAEREQRAQRPCRSCGRPVGPSDGPGRPRVMCSDCRASES